MSLDKSVKEEYDKRFNEFEKDIFRVNNAPAYIINRYAPKFSGMDAANLLLNNCFPELANEYDFNRFSVSDMCSFGLSKCEPELVNTYNIKFTVMDISDLCGEERLQKNYAVCSPAIANTFAARLGGKVIRYFFNNNISKEYVESFSDSFEGVHIVGFIRNGLKPGDVNLYSGILPGNVINHLHETGLSLEKASKYPAFLRKDIYVSKLMVNDIFAEEAESYISRFGESFDGEDIEILHAYKLTPQFIEDNSFEGLAQSFVAHIKNMGYWKADHEWFLNIGKDSIVFTDNYGMVKFSKNIAKEKEMREIIIRSGKKFKNVVQYIKEDEYSRDHILTTPIKGRSSELLMYEEESTPENDILQYGLGIVNGLLELKSIGINYYGDAKPGNIIIEEDTNTPKLIDTEYSSTDPEGKARPEGNRRFGTKDLPAVGETLYALVTKMSIFSKSTPQNKDLSDIADEIYVYRKIVYKDKTGLEINAVCRKIDENIKDKKLGYLIKQCLVSDHTDKEMMYKLFEKAAGKVAE